MTLGKYIKQLVLKGPSFKANVNRDIVNYDTGEVYFAGTINIFSIELINPNFEFVEDDGKTIWFIEVSQPFVTLNDIKKYLNEKEYGLVELLNKYGYEEDYDCPIDKIVESLSWQYMLMEDPAHSDYMTIRYMVTTLDEFTFMLKREFINNPKYKI